MIKNESPLLNELSRKNEYSFFPRFIITNTKREYGYKSISNFTILSNTELEANVKGKVEHIVRLKYIRERLYMGCSCTGNNPSAHQTASFPGSKPCVHEVALFLYAANNASKLQIDYQYENQHLNIEYLLKFYELMLDMNSKYYLSDVEKNNFNNYLIEIFDYLFILLKEEPDTRVYRIFLGMIELIDIYQHSLKQINKNLLQINEYFWQMIKESNQYFLTAWEEIFGLKLSEQICDFIYKRINKLNTDEEAKNVANFVSQSVNLLKQIKQPKTYYYEDKINNHYINLVILQSICIKFYDYNEYLNFLMSVAHNNQTMEKIFADVVYFSSDKNLIEEYIENNLDSFPYIRIMKTKHDLENKAIKEEQYIKEIFALFDEEPSINNLVLIKKITEEDTFKLMQASILKTVKSKNRPFYYRAVLIVDFEQGFEELKKAGVLVLNDFAMELIPQYEDFLIDYYQVELYDILKTIRGKSMRLTQAMKCLMTLASMRNGRYYALLLYRKLHNEEEYFHYSAANGEYIDFLAQLKF